MQKIGQEGRHRGAGIEGYQSGGKGMNLGVEVSGVGEGKRGRGVGGGT